MRNPIRSLAFASTVAASLAAASVLYAHETQGSGGSATGSGMMDQGGMMGMMGQMTNMMENCNKMMQSMDHHGSGKSGEGMHKGAPGTGSSPDKKN